MDSVVSRIAEATIQAASTVFETMTRLEARVVETAPSARDPVAISGIVGLAGERFRISVIVHFPERLAVRATAEMLGVAPETLSPDGEDVQDAVGEIANMLAGRLKNLMFHEQLTFEISLPSVVTGEGFQIGQRQQAEAFRYQLEVAGHPCWIEVAVLERGRRVAGLP